MRVNSGMLLILLTVWSTLALAQVSPRQINGARNSSADGTTLDTNVAFSLRMTLAGDSTLRESAESGQAVSIIATISPETADIGQPADIILVDYQPPSLTMRNQDGNFVSWNGSLRSLTPFQEGVTLSDNLDVEVFSGTLGTTGNHRIFVGFLVGEALYFTPSALRIDITEPVTPELEPTAREQAIELFNSTISSRIVQGRCVTCHRSGGQADNQALHEFVFSSNSNHLTINFEQFENLHTARGTSYILSKVQGQLSHGGGALLTSGSSDFTNLSNFLDLLDQAATD